MRRKNLLRRTDGYKYSHWPLYPPGTRHIYSYEESRGGIFSYTTWFGLQGTLKEHMVGEVITMQDVDDMAKMCYSYFGNGEIFNYDGMKKLVEKHKGKLPLRIKSVPEGMVVPTHNVLMTVENTDPEFPWLTNLMETLLMTGTWYPTTVATQSRAIKELFMKYAVATGDPSWIRFKLHDFGFRGVSSVESAGVGGAAHLINFCGTDTMEGIWYAQEYYGADANVGLSIPAGEHSTFSSWGREHEADAYANAMKMYPDGYVAIVADTWNIYDACRKLFGDSLRQLVRGRNGTVVVRPDSGCPWEVVPDVLKILEECFGCQLNDKGYKVLPRCIRVIQGDGVNYESIDKILSRMMRDRYSIDNIAFGMGGALLQKLTEILRSLRSSVQPSTKAKAGKMFGRTPSLTAAKHLSVGVWR